MSAKRIVRGLVGVGISVFALHCGGTGTGAGTSSPSGTSGDPSGTDPGTSAPVPGVTTDGGTVVYGETYEGGEFHLGPVDYEETQWHNACAPATKYSSAARKAQGQLLAGLWQGIPNVAGYCDACVLVKTAKGKSALLRVVTYGDTTKNSLDVSPEAFALLDSGEYPRTMSWQFASCPDTGKPIYEFQTEASEWWSSLWVRNVRLPVAKVEVKSQNHPDYVALERGGDGTLTDAKGFGKGAFTIRVTSIDGKSFEETFEWPADGIGGKSMIGKTGF